LKRRQNRAVVLGEDYAVGKIAKRFLLFRTPSNSMDAFNFENDFKDLDVSGSLG
jgi:hypothetical protein